MEVCDLNPQKTCRFIKKLVPKLLLRLFPRDQRAPPSRPTRSRQHSTSPTPSPSTPATSVRGLPGRAGDNSSHRGFQLSPSRPSTAGPEDSSGLPSKLIPLL